MTFASYSFVVYCMVPRQQIYYNITFHSFDLKIMRNLLFILSPPKRKYRSEALMEFWN